MEKFGHIDTWLFDLDNTLYDARTGVFDQIIARMTEYVAALLHVTTEEANDIRCGYWQKYGTTLYGLMQEHDVDPAHFLQHAHDVDISGVPQCDTIKDSLARLPGRKIVFTNSSRAFARRMTEHLGIDGHFEGTFAIEDARYLPKPRPEPYLAIIDNFSFDPKKAAMFDDMRKNLETAAENGMTTVWISGTAINDSGVNDAGGGKAGEKNIHHRAATLEDWMREALPPR